MSDTTRDTPRPPLLQPGDSIQGEWPDTRSLDNCTFTFEGRSVPGSKLAELLGLTEPPPTPTPNPIVSALEYLGLALLVFVGGPLSLYYLGWYLGVVLKAVYRL